MQLDHRSLGTRGVMTLQSTCSPTYSEGEKRFGTKAIAMARQKWYSQHKESKYSDDQFINRTSLMKEYPSIDLKDSEFKVRGHVITFTTNTINELLGAPHVDPEPLKTMITKPPYQHIHYFLYDTRSMARQHGVPGEDTDYLPPVGDRPLDISRTKGPSPHGVNLTMLKYNARTDKITTRITSCSDILHIGPDFDEPIDNDAPIDEERRMAYSYDETEEEE
ncbi:hypothetical protein FXO38_22877 [Capsicum annuum]|nr:hypothetical protein FXO38_22877 [Capsicum annuum]